MGGGQLITQCGLLRGFTGPLPNPPQLQAGLEQDKLSQLGSVLPESRTPWAIRSPLLYTPSEGWGVAVWVKGRPHF